MCYGNVPPHTEVVDSLLILIASGDHPVKPPAQNWSHYSRLLRTLANQAFNVDKHVDRTTMNPQSKLF